MKSSSTRTLTRVAKVDDERYRGEPEWDEDIPLKFDVIIHPAASNAIIINYPGYNGDINGYNQKYYTLAKFLAQKSVGAVIQMGNHRWAGFEYAVSVVEDLRAVIRFALENASEICGTDKPQIYLMGFSAGASAAAAICNDFPEITKILLMAPSGDAGEEAVRRGLEAFAGEVYIVVGKEDEVVGAEAANIFGEMVKQGRMRKIEIPNCDHQFRGELNGRIMSAAPLWAFANDQSFPDPTGGIKLYD